MKSKKENNGVKFICLQSASGPVMIPYRLERSQRLRRLQVSIDGPHHVLLKMPMRQTERRGIQFMKEHAEWICQTFASQDTAPLLTDHLLRHRKISLHGRWYKVTMGFRKGACSHNIDTAACKVLLFLDPDRPREPQLIKLLRDIARIHLPIRVRHLSERSGIRIHGVTVRDQRSRWGSCSETGGISLNWRLILISPRLQDHVILHELAHMLHFDHSQAFHKRLEKLDPQTRKHARLLDEEASRFINIGRLPQ